MWWWWAICSSSSICWFIVSLFVRDVTHQCCAIFCDLKKRCNTTTLCYFLQFSIKCIMSLPPPNTTFYYFFFWLSRLVATQQINFYKFLLLATTCVIIIYFKWMICKLLFSHSFLWHNNPLPTYKLLGKYMHSKFLFEMKIIQWGPICTQHKLIIMIPFY
jgi:hypothetical protein